MNCHPGLVAIKVLHTLLNISEVLLKFVIGFLINSLIKYFISKVTLFCHFCSLKLNLVITLRG